MAVQMVRLRVVVIMRVRVPVFMIMPVVMVVVMPVMMMIVWHHFTFARVVQRLPSRASS